MHICISTKSSQSSLLNKTWLGIPDRHGVIYALYKKKNVN